MAEETIILLFCGCCSVGVAVTMANLFDFAGGNRFLEQNLVILTASLQPLSDFLEEPVSDPLIGKIKGTMGAELCFYGSF